jgi:hypothetical protein
MIVISAPYQIRMTEMFAPFHTLIYFPQPLRILPYLFDPLNHRHNDTYLDSGHHTERSQYGHSSELPYFDPSEGEAA